MTFAPILLAATPQAFVPLAYIVHIRPTRCRACSTLTEHSEVYALNEMRSRTGAGKMVMNLTPCSELRYRLPTRIHHLSLREVPICHECVGTPAATAAMSHLPDGHAEREFALTLARKAAAAEAPDAADSPKRSARATVNPQAILDIL